MNKLILCLLVIISFPLYSQDDSALELNEEGVEVNPLEKTDEAAPAESSEVVITTEEPAPAEEVTETPETVEEIVAPLAYETKPALITETEVETKKSFSPLESHWYTTMGFEAMEYTLPFSYTGSKESFDEENRNLYGGRLGFGGEIYLGAGFLISTRVEGYYMGTLFESAQTAGPELEDEVVGTVKDAGQIYGGDIVQTLSFMWELKTKNPIMQTMTYLMVEPFLEIGVGRAWAFNKKDYSYDTGTCPTCAQEEYDQSFNDELTNVRVGGGINFTSRQGFFLFLKATENRYDITKRRTKGYFYSDDDTRTDVSPTPGSELGPIIVYSLGGGYKF
jgi:hypothetical protein